MTNNTSILANLPKPSVDIDLGSFYAEIVQWFAHHWGRILVAGVVALAIVAVLYAVRSLAVRFCNRDRPGKHDWWLIFGRTFAKTTRSFIVLAAVQSVVAIADPPQIVASIFIGLFTIVAVLQGAIWARELILGAVEIHTGDGVESGESLSSAMGIIRLLVSFAVFAIALVVVLDNLGVNITGLVAGLGVGGIAIGLAAQGIFGDLFAALAIILDRPFRVGDVIGYDNTVGKVEAIGLKSTRIRPASGEEHIIANKILLDKEIQNLSQRDHRRHKFVIGVTYQTAPEVIERLPSILKEEVEHCGQNFAHAGFANFNASSLDVEVEYDTPSPDFLPWHQARHAVGIAILKRLAKEGIEIAYPTQTTFTAAPDGKIIMPYADVQAVKRVDLKDGEA